MEGGDQGQEFRASNRVAAIQDRSFMARMFNSEWMMVGPDDRSYQIAYETQPNVSISRGFNFYANDTLSDSSNNKRAIIASATRGRTDRKIPAWRKRS